MKPAPEYDERGYIYRGRVVARRPAQDPDTVWSCPTCAALVIDNDRSTHESWHERLDNPLYVVEGKGDLH